MTKIAFTGIGLFSLILLSIHASAQRTNAADDYSAYMAEVRALNRRISREMDMPDSTQPTVLKPSTIRIQAGASKISLRVFKPDLVRAVVLDIHGGGWSNGMAAYDDSLNDEMARACMVAVVSVDYRLASDVDPFPVCLDDCKSAAKWVLDNSSKMFGTGKVLISGGSAGAHLAAATTVYVKDSLNRIESIVGVNLMYGCYDLSRTPSCRQVTDSTILLSKGVVEYVWSTVFKDWSPEQLRDPRYSPLYADLRGMPPAMFSVGTSDPLLDDTMFMEARWRSAGGSTFLAVYPECTHAFNTFGSRIGAVANKKVYDWMNDLLGH